jgi:hypothetical protein
MIMSLRVRRCGMAYRGSRFCGSLWKTRWKLVQDSMFLSNQISTQGVLRWLKSVKQEIHGDRSKMTMKNQKVVENIILKHLTIFRKLDHMCRSIRWSEAWKSWEGLEEWIVCWGVWR